MSPHPEQMRQTPRVLVAGGGPVGLLAALTLARHGIASRVVEADPDVCEGSRAICISRRSLQVLDRLGVASPFLETGLHWTRGTSYLGTEEVYRLAMPHGPQDRFPPFVNLQQFYAESFLRDACVETGLVEILWDRRVVGVDAREDGVALEVEHGGETVRHEGAWLVATDGARSTVRQALGLSLEGRSYESRYLIADIRLVCDWPTERKVWFDPVSNPGSTVIMHKQPDDVWRIDIQLRPGEAPEAALAESAVRARIATHLAMVGLPSEWELLWRSLYRAHTLSLDDYVHGRVLFAGDAAHLVPIFGVRGLNSGIDDAMNLGFKLALVLQGEAGPDILATYTQERRGAYLENIAAATKSTWFMSPPSHGYVVARDAVLELATRHPRFSALIDPRQSGAHRYASGMIEAPAKHPLVGLPLPEARLSSGESLHALVAPGFCGLLISAGADAPRVRGNTVDGRRLPVITLPANDAASVALDAQPGLCFLLRPDGYVAAVREAVDDKTAAAALASMLDAIGLAGEGEGHVQHA